MIIGTLMALETCLIHGQVSLNLLYSKRNLQTDICGPGEINEKTADIQARSFMARTLEKMGKNAKLKELTLRARNLRRPSRMLARNWKHKLKNCVNGEKSNKVKSKLACILEASESTRLRMGESLPTHHEDHIA